MKNLCFVVCLLVSGCATAGRHVASAKISSILTPGMSYICQGGMTAKFVGDTILFGSQRSAKEDHEYASLNEGILHSSLDPNGFNQDRSKEPGFLATLVVADPGGAGVEAQIYALGKDHFRLVPDGGSSLIAGECSAAGR